MAVNIWSDRPNGYKLGESRTPPFLYFIAARKPKIVRNVPKPNTTALKRGVWKSALSDCKTASTARRIPPQIVLLLYHFLRMPFFGISSLISPHKTNPEGFRKKKRISGRFPEERGLGGGFPAATAPLLGVSFFLQKHEIFLHPSYRPVVRIELWPFI